jgi:hypothetical protein
MRPHAEIDAHDLPASDLLADPVREVDPDRDRTASCVSAVTVGLGGRERVLVRQLVERVLVGARVNPPSVGQTPLDALDG